jgi:hypothetical protein
MKYQVSLANNLRVLQPDLPIESIVESPAPLTINEIAAKVGVHSLLMVAGIIGGALYPLDEPVRKDAEIVLLGPVAGG